MFRKILSLILAAALILCLAACGKIKAPSAPDLGEESESIAAIADNLDKKVAILVAPESQYPEDYLAAKELEAKYPDNIIVKEYKDSRIITAGNPDIMTISQELAKDKTVGAVIYARATQFTYSAIQAAKEINPDLFAVAVEPECDASGLSLFADLTIDADRTSFSSDIISEAKNAGADYFVFLSYDRHVEKNIIYKQLRDNMEKNCESEGITFVYHDITDPISDDFDATEESAAQVLASLEENGEISGSNVAVFSTDSTVQGALVTLAEEKGWTYICPSFPTAYNGVADTVKTEYPDSVNDTQIIVSSLETALESTETEANLYVYNYPLASVMLRGAVYTAFTVLKDGEVYSVSDTAIDYLCAAAGNSDTFTASYDDTVDNAVACYAPGFVKIK